MKIWIVEVERSKLSPNLGSKCLGEIGFIPNRGDRLIVGSGEYVVECINYDIPKGMVVVFVKKDTAYYKNNMSGVILIS